MAKSKSASSHKISFGKRKGGKYKKTNGPKEKQTKAYVGQGRK